MRGNSSSQIGTNTRTAVWRRGKPCIQNLENASDHLEEHNLALEDATAAQKKLDIYLYYFFRFFDLISSHVREFKNYILDPNVPMHHKMLYASLYCFLVYLLVFLVVLKMHGLIGVACSPLVGDTEKCRVLQQARRHEQAAARSAKTVAADMTFNCNDVVYDERGTKALVTSMMYVWKEVEKNNGDPPRSIMAQVEPRKSIMLYVCVQK